MDEARVISSLQIRKGFLNYSGQPTSFTADVEGTKGPCPGAFAASTGGTDVDLSELDQPGFYRITNLDATNYVEYGIYVTGTGVFVPWGECGPGESYVGKFSRNFREQYTGSGTGTTAEVNTMRVKANTEACNVVVEAFEA